MQVTSRFDFSTVSVQREHTVTLMVRIKAPPSPQTVERKPLNLALVLDRSGSMEGEKLEYARRAAIQLVNQLSARDRLAVVIYDDQVATLVPSQPVTDKEAIRTAIRRIPAGGSTNLSGGWMEGLSHVEASFSPEALNRVLLLTDGLANAGIMDHGRLREIGGQYRAKGITTTTFGFGADFDEELLQSIADEAGGAFHFIENSDQAPAAFVQEFGELLSVVGQNLTVEIRGLPPAKLVAVLNKYPIEPIEGGLRIRLGDLFADEQREVLGELFIPAISELGPRVVGEIIASVDQVVQPVGRQIVLQAVEVNLVEAETAQAQPDAEIIRAVSLLRLSDVRDQAIDLIRRRDFRGADACIAATASDLKSAGPLDPEMASELGRLREEFEAAKDRPEYGAKVMSYQCHQQRRGRGRYRK